MQVGKGLNMVAVLNAVKSVSYRLRIIVLMICGVFSIFPGTGRGTAAQTGDIKGENLCDTRQIVLDEVLF